MPNTPALVGQGGLGLCPRPGATADDGQLVGQLLGAVGKAFAVDEKLLDAVTGLSGSGPAFVYVMIEALSDGGVRMGLPREIAAGPRRPDRSRCGRNGADDRRAPGGAEGQSRQPRRHHDRRPAALEDRGLRAALIAAVEAATRRSQELGK